MAVVELNWGGYGYTYSDPQQPRYFNCKRCGAVGQKDICEYCGSAPDEKEESENEKEYE